MTDGGSLSRTAVMGAALGLSLLASGTAQAQAPKLLVYLHVSLKQRAFQGLLQTALPGVDVTAVGRISDFDRAMADSPDAVLTLPMVLSAKNMHAQLQGQRGGSGEEKYALVGSDSAPDPGNVKAVGALDVLGRDGTNQFVTRMLGGAPKVERVTKVEDLLPLLQMQRVDAILIPQRLLSDVKSASRINLVPRELATQIGLPAVASIGSAGPTISAGIAKLPVGLSQTMGVDAWH
ncbi:MAG TPA: hypothetical protein VFK05_06590 [Polyangiaceae bacterium]|nr:hypothetical protein [Polyangiaceae bacterium]